MRWLVTENPGALRMECTGFGLNLVSGNFEFACLIVVDSDEFWSRYRRSDRSELGIVGIASVLEPGQRVADRARRTDDGWSNEGLFAFLQGLRRLQQIGGDRWITRD